MKRDSRQEGAGGQRRSVSERPSEYLDSPSAGPNRPDPQAPDPRVSREQGLGAVLGIETSGITAGLKPSGRPDVALVRSLGPEHHAAAVFTANRFAAAPVRWSREVVSDGRVDAVVLNSGGANACTGPEGFAHAQATAETVGRKLGVAAGDVLVCSTGMIGQQLPMDVLLPGVEKAVEQLAAGDEAAARAAEAIMTTDTRPKQAALVLESEQGPVHLGGIAKGAGMLAPSLATMLVVLATDASLTAEQLETALGQAVGRSFERTDSDGCMSTNDTVVLLGTGASGIVPEMEEFTQALTGLCTDLARQLIGDAEGASHDLVITTCGAASEIQAVEVSRAVSRSNLVKAAIFGNDPNWGRILSEVGTTSADFAPEEVDVSINEVMVCRGGQIGEDRSQVDLSAEREVRILIDLHAGRERATLWSNDLTHDYVEENSAYST